MPTDRAGVASKASRSSSNGMADTKSWENTKGNSVASSFILNGNVMGEKWLRLKNTAVLYKIPPAVCQMRESPYENPSAETFRST